LPALALGWCSWQQKQKSSKKIVTAAIIEQHFPKSHTDEAPTCVVCLSTVEVGEPCRRTQCWHEFHADCIMQWWTYKPRKVLRCPTCRRQQHVKRKKTEVDVDDLREQQQDGPEQQLDSVAAPDLLPREQPEPQ